MCKKETTSSLTGLSSDYRLLMKRLPSLFLYCKCSPGVTTSQLCGHHTVWYTVCILKYLTHMHLLLHALSPQLVKQQPGALHTAKGLSQVSIMSPCMCVCVAVLPGSLVDGRSTAWQWRRGRVLVAAAVWLCPSTPTSYAPFANWGGGQPSRRLQRA